jgi:hypothetical protein
MSKVSFLLSDLGFFNLHPDLLPHIKSSIDSISLRTDLNLINLFYHHGNSIANNCFLRIEDIPIDIFNTKKISIYKDQTGCEKLIVNELDGDVVMKYW